MKHILVDFTVRIAVPFEDQYANKEHVEFTFNEGTWSWLNFIDWLEDMQVEDLLMHSHATYVREATEDEAIEYSV